MFSDFTIKRKYQDPKKLKGASRLWYEFWFWGHITVWSTIVLLPFVVPLWAVVVAFVLYEWHLMLLDGCLFTRWQQQYGILPEGEEYYQAMFRRAFGLKSGSQQSLKYSF